MRLAAAALMLFAVHALAANTPADYAYVFPIETGAPAANANTSAWRVDLTPEVYRWVQDSRLRDIEIFNAAGHPVPMGVVVREPTTVAHETHAYLPALEVPAAAGTGGASDLHLVIDRDAGGRLRRIDAGEQKPSPLVTRDWILDASAFDHAIDSLALTWRDSASGVIAHFAIDASDDLEHWRSVGSGTVLALEQDGARIDRRVFPLNRVRARYLRLHRTDDGAPLTQLGAGASSVEHTSEMPELTWIDAAHVASSEPAPPGVTRFEYTLPAPLPIDVARIGLATDNALAKVWLYARLTDVPGTSWVRTAPQTAFRLRSGDEEVLRNDDLAIHLTLRADAFRIESANAIAEAPELRLGYRPDRIVFLAEGAGPYMLAVGSIRAFRADFPLDAALSTLRSSLGKDWQPPPATLGASKASGGEAILRTAPPPIAWRQWLLWAVLVGGAALIAGLAISLLRGAKPPPG